jgi:hypothetical protein
MLEFISPLTFLLILNSVLTIGFILNQNESTKDAINTQTSSSPSNPLEKLTWISLFVQVILLLVKIKITET